ncbi:MAG: CgeB family protein [Anaerolineae bacterium]
MRVVMFYHSLLSDWNHGNAHFLRGVVTELIARGHDVAVYEPRDAWSLQNLLHEHGSGALRGFFRAYPGLFSHRYLMESLDLERALYGADLAIVHEWNPPELVGRIGAHRARVGGYRLLFHDTHHRCVTDPESMAAYDLRRYDGVLAFSGVVRDLYLERRWTERAWAWHEAADVRVFAPRQGVEHEGDLVWIGNWGDGERTQELQEYLFGPVRALGLTARVYGVRYPEEALQTLAASGVEYAGWLPNYEVPAAYARFGVTVHVPRRPYVSALPGTPTIRVFEAMACGIPLVCSPWDDVEHLFQPGRDYRVAANGDEMVDHLRLLLTHPAAAARQACHARNTILARHTCAHRVNELLGICAELGVDVRTEREYLVPNLEVLADG